MLAFCKMAVVVCSTVLFIAFSNVVQGGFKAVVPALGSWIVTVEQPADTAKTGKPVKQEKKDKAVTISITDEGIRIGSEDGEKVIFELDAKKLQEKMEQIGDSLASAFDDWEFNFDNGENRFYHKDRGRDLVKFGDRLHIGKHELVRGDIVVIGDDIDVEGKVMGNVVSVFGNIDLARTAIVNGEVICVLGTLTQHDRAKVRGETVVIGESYPSFNWIFPAYGKGAFKVVSRIVMFIVSILLLGIVLAFLSDRMKKSSRYVFGSFFKSLGVGVLVFLVGSVVIAILAIILSITIIGIPIAVLLIFSFVALTLLGYFVSALALGDAVARKFNMETDSLFIRGLLGLFLLSLLGFTAALMYFNPFFFGLRVALKSIGGLVSFLALLNGVGAFVLSKGGTLPLEAKPEMTE